MKHVAKKRFGQNFLTDQGVIDSLVDAISPKADDLMVEIGPGLGALTKPLLHKLDMLHVVEVDRDIIDWMQKEYAKKSITIHNSDALKFDFGSLGKNLRVVGNLPYNISTPILFHLLDNVRHITDMHFMLQKEVVERMVATPGDTDFGRISVMLQYRFHIEWLIDVPPESFDPAPKVQSAVVRLIPKDVSELHAKKLEKLSQVVQTAFSQRRKMLRSALSSRYGGSAPAEEVLSSAGIDPTLRGEALEISAFVAIARREIEIGS